MVSNILLILECGAVIAAYYFLIFCYDRYRAYKPSVWLIDDNQGDLLWMSAELEKRGFHKVRTFSTPKKIPAVMLPDYAFVDVHLTGSAVDGIVVADTLRRAQVKSYLMSGRAPGEHLDKDAELIDKMVEIMHGDSVAA